MPLPHSSLNPCSAERDQESSHEESEPCSLLLIPPAALWSPHPTLRAGVCRGQRGRDLAACHGFRHLHMSTALREPLGVLGSIKWTKPWPEQKHRESGGQLVARLYLNSPWSTCKGGRWREPSTIEVGLVQRDPWWLHVLLEMSTSQSLLRYLAACIVPSAPHLDPCCVPVQSDIPWASCSSRTRNERCARQVCSNTTHQSQGNFMQ